MKVKRVCYDVSRNAFNVLVPLGIDTLLKMYEFTRTFFLFDTQSIISMLIDDGVLYVTEVGE